ncbi:acyl-CoA thioesterase [Shewanella benthica]|uniref:Hypothetical 4-hydroxybenzoyl-CoA thioesterase n=1 Tax=Shewanella benthica KT99 TaxID=314608 RepID=A9D4W6_9GAMM|nr:thioesterase family protein [Shewanella benthica]EDQ01326.1 hypothetical 4-hydroxybenzoyl-CoA thioesterase [Shewanella benthica KT99]
MLEQFIAQNPVHTEITVAWGEMDALQHVNNVVYFKYFETARIDFFSQVNLLGDIKADRFMMNYTVFSKAQAAVTTLGSSQVVMFNFNTGKKATLTPELVDALRTYEEVKS